MAIAAIVLTAAIASAAILSSYIIRSTHPNRQTIEAIDIKALVERIIKVESTGVADKRNKHSSATGAGQFLDDTWLEAVRKHRRDLIKGRSDPELLKLRQDPELLGKSLRGWLSNMLRLYETGSASHAGFSLSNLFRVRPAPWLCYPAQKMPTPLPLWPPLT
ncbi:MAG: hypothetical protein HY852_19515 [Bradyrhizobium sp.]|uniref:hypothetical protein n=1 Tax=Bradyrhizobium sp. TaxID=376 RepID=UPI0025BC0E5B|nr:hypothetical protein [Bradyrhizobium sp.]MBI5263999.1 hypothetical protein [Bradyrhizobium sp.]